MYSSSVSNLAFVCRDEEMRFLAYIDVGTSEITPWSSEAHENNFSM